MDLNYFDITNSAKYLEIESETFIQSMVSKNILQPFNKETYRYENGYLFAKEDLDKLRERPEYQRIKLTEQGYISLRDAADKLRVTPKTLLNHMRLKNLEVKTIELEQRKFRYLKFEDAEKSLIDYKKKSNSSVVRARGLSLLQLIEIDNELYRLVGIDNKASIFSLLSYSHKEIKLKFDDKDHCSLKTPYKIHEQGYLRRGTKSVIFEIPQSDIFSHSTGSMIDFLLKSIDTKYYHIENCSGYFKIIVADGVSIMGEYSELKKFLKVLDLYLIKGSVRISSTDGLKFENNLITIKSLEIPSEIEISLKKIGIETETQIKEYLIENLSKLLKEGRA